MQNRPVHATVRDADAQGAGHVGAEGVELPVTQPAQSVGRVDAAVEWRRGLTGVTMGLLLFETITGLAIYVLPFSVFE